MPLRRPAVKRETEFRPTQVMVKISAVFEKYGDKAMSQREVLDIVGGKSETARHAFSLLRLEGYVSDKSPHKLLKPYHGDKDAENYDDDL